MCSLGVGIAFAVGGMLVLAAIVFRWEWLLKHWKTRRVYVLLGNTGAIVLYVILGLSSVVVGVLLITGLLALE